MKMNINIEVEGNEAKELLKRILGKESKVEEPAFVKAARKTLKASKKARSAALFGGKMRKHSSKQKSDKTPRGSSWLSVKNMKMTQFVNLWQSATSMTHLLKLFSVKPSDKKTRNLLAQRATALRKKNITLQKFGRYGSPRKES